jgi:hypothetical protein
MSYLYCSITKTDNVQSVNISNSHSNSCAQAVFTTNDTSLDIGDSVTIDLGYVDHHSQLFKGYVKQKERKIPDGSYTISCYDKMIRAVDYFMVSSNPDAPWTRDHIEAGDLVEAVMAEAGLTNFTGDNTHFELGINSNVEVNLVSAYDFCKQIADIVTWALWADQNGQIHFENRKPFVMDGTQYTGHGQAGYHTDPPSTNTPLTDKDFLDFTYKRSEKDLRNKIQVYGVTGISAEAHRATSLDPSIVFPYSYPESFTQILPNGFYKTAAVATTLIDSQSLAQDSADYNLILLNRIEVGAVCTIVGNPDYDCRQVIGINEAVTGLSEDWYIFSIQQSWGKSGFQTYLELVR